MTNVDLEFETIFSTIPKQLRGHLKQTYSKIIINYNKHHFEPSELNGGKFCETVFRILEWYSNTDNSYLPFGQSIRNFEQSLKRFENQTNLPDSLRFHIPKMLISIYVLRNKRGVGHIGGDVNPNYMDASIIVSVSKWILAELVRLLHNISLEEAEKYVENIITKEYPLIWEVFSKKRVLDTDLDYKQKSLVLLYAEYPTPLKEKQLFDWIEYSNSSLFRSQILLPLHKIKLVEYDKNTKDILISPKGIEFVEKNIDLKL